MDSRNVLRQIWDTASTVLLDVRYGAVLRGNKLTPYASLGAYDTCNSDYGALPQMFVGRIKPADVLVDVGCGKGRVINWWLNQGVQNRIVGIDLDDEVARRTRMRLQRYANVSILSGDAVELLPEDGTLFYLFNPFNAEVMKRFCSRVQRIAAQNKQHSATVVYYNCKYLDVWKACSDVSIEMGKSRLHSYAIMDVRPTNESHL